ncbi:MAG: DUF6798 domain-containing protein [Chloroflexota bacterium]|nr:DUF6798 domain-containing protein [Chloroflexota bacterium]
MVKRVSQYLASHSLSRHLLFLALAFLAVAVNGYHFGTFDQVFHIPFLKKFVDPTLYPGDSFLSLRWYHFSFFWFPFIPLLKAGLLEISLFIVHILTVYGTIWMFWELTNTLFQNNIANLLIVLALVIPHLGFPGFQIIEFSLLNRTFVLPFLLGSMVLYLNDKKWLAFLVLGLMFNLHVIYAIFVLCMFLLNEVLTFKWRAWWKPALWVGIFVAAGSPVLIWRMQTGSGIDFSLRPEMLNLATKGLLSTVYYPLTGSAYGLGNLVAGLGTVWAFMLGLRRAPKSDKHRTMRNFALAVGVLIMVGLIASYILPVTILLQMQILRVGVFMLFFGMIYLTHFISEAFTSGEIDRGRFLILALSFVLLFTPLLTILIYYLDRWLAHKDIKPAWLLVLITAIQTVTVIAGLASQIWAPGYYIHGPQSDWRRVQDWARVNTPQDAMFISPPQIFGHYTPDWRVFSERGTVFTTPELMEIPFAPSFIPSIKERLSAVAPGALAQFDGDYIKTLELTGKAYYTNSREDFIKLACEYQADYLVVESSHPYNFLTVYQNDGFFVYHLPDCQ